MFIFASQMLITYLLACYLRVVSCVRTNMDYTLQEYADMIICYGMANENASVARHIYAERFPNRERQPSDRAIAACVRRMRETGTLFTHHRNGAAAVRRDVRDEEAVLRAFEENPGSSVRRVSDVLGIPRSTVHLIIRENGLHPYHYQRVQQLLARDEGQRVNFCEAFLAQCRRNVSFPDTILWTDGATFTPNGVFNSHNFILWEDENPHAVRQGAFQYRWSINVWAGVIADRVIGPYFLPLRLNGQAYAEFLEQQLPVLLEDLPLCARQTLIYQQDGAPAHSSRRAREILNTRFPDRWMGRGGPVTWPARSPDLNVLDYFVWGYIKASVEHRRDSNEHEVREAILAAFNTITPDMAHRATQQITRRAELCLQARGGHFEQLLN